MTFELNEAGLAELLSSGQAQAFVHEAATGVARDWERLDPRTNPGGHEPPEITVGTPHIEHGAATVDVSTADGIWHIIEFGSANNPPYRPATKAVQNAGLEMKGGR